jgi:sugar phosphate isomerase/epimerase
MKNFCLKTLFWTMAINLVTLFAMAQSNFPASNEADWETGVALYSFNRFSFVDALEKADRAGVDVVEGFFFHKLGEEFKNKTMADISGEEIKLMKKLMDQKGIKMKSMYVGGAENEADWRNFFEIGQEMGMDYLVGEPEKKDWDLVDKLAGEYRIKMAIHQHSKESGSLYWHPDSVLAAIKNHPNIGACGDVGHWARSGLDPVDCLEKLEGHLLGIHLKDIDQLDENAEDVTVGTGAIDFPAVVRELERQNFEGIVHVECEHNMEDNLTDVIQALEYFEELAGRVTE